MATSAPAPAPAAAPAAPSAGAQPTAQPTPGAGNEAALPAAGPTRGALKPIPSLPGVFPDEGDPFPPSPSPPSRADATSDPTRSGTQAPRGPDGRFVAGPSPATGADGEHALEAGPPEPPPPATPKFKFAGEEFDSAEAAEQNFKSLRGQFRPIQALARSLGGVDKIIPQFSQAAESARGWKAEAERLTAELASARNGQPGNPDTPTTPDATPAAEADVDWDLYAEIKKLAIDSGEPWKAEQWLIGQVREIERARFDARLDERLAPQAEREAQQAVAAKTEALFGSLAGYTNSDGSVAFPELHDEAASYEVGKMWASMGLPPEAALTPQGAIAAIAIYRMAKGVRTQSQARPATQPAATSPTATPPASTDARVAADLADGRVRTLSAPSGDAPSAEAARILASLRQVHQGNRALLGFEA